MPPQDRPSPTRRQVLAGGAVLLAGAAVGARALGGGEEAIGLYAQCVAFADEGSRRILRGTASEVADVLVPGSRVLRGARHVSRVRAAEEHAVATLAPRVGPEFADLAATALLDAHALRHELPAPVAGWNRNWRYVWPRDAAHVIAVDAELGRLAPVLDALTFLATHQGADGWFEARYTVDGGVPDLRPRQSDGAGWFLWALGRAVAAMPEHTDVLLRWTRGPARLAVRAIAADLDQHGGLPAPSPDYWEVRERELTLGTAAVLLAGLQSAGALPGLGATGRLAADRAASLAARLREAFGPGGYRRYASDAGYDAALTFLLPPYVRGFEAEAGPLLDAAWVAMRRPAGGVAPGVDWHEDYYSWTPETALFAQAWAHLGRGDRAGDVLRWLGDHRTALGALPEKVSSGGSPAAVAPLAWTAALVTSTALRLGG